MAATRCRPLLLCISLSALAAGCLNQQSVEAQSPECEPAAAAPVETDEDRQVTFYRDLLPILQANSGERTYKCTTCHAHMNAPEGLNSVSKVEDTIKSMKTGRMPRSNSRVTDAEIKLFDLWRLQGFQPGDPSDTPVEPAGNAAGKSGNCSD